MHEDLLYEESLSFSFNEIEYHFHLAYFDKSASFSIKSLPCTPRVGEQVRVPYFKNYVGTSHFYMDSINNKFEDTKQTIQIFLKDGEYNRYWHIRRGEAKCKRELSCRDFYEKYDYEIKRELEISE